MDRVLARFYGATFLYAVAQAIAVPLAPEFLDLEFASTFLFIGIVMSVYGLMQIVLRLPMGDMADRRGRKPSILLAFVFTLASALFLAFAPNAWWVVPGIAFIGLSGGIFWVAANSYLFDRATDVPKATSDYTLALGASFLVGPPIGHLIADAVGFRAAFALCAVAAVLGFLLTLTLPETPPARRPRATSSPYVRAWGLLRHRALVISAAGTFLYSMVFSVFTTFFQLHVLAVGLTITVAGFLLGGRQAAALVVRFRLPEVLRAVGAVNVLLVGVLLSGLATILVPFTSGLWGLIGIVAIGGAATGIMIPANLMLVHEGAPKDERGLANGIYGTMLGLGALVAPLVFGFVGAQWGSAWTFWAAGGTVLALGFGVLVASRP